MVCGSFRRAKRARLFAVFTESVDGRADYERIGVGYTTTRQADPRIAAAISEALGDAQSVLNVGAGAGSYEPTDRTVVAVEPSMVMAAQRPAGAAPVIQATAEELPFADGEFDAVMAILSDHHWRDRSGAFRELRRVAGKRVVLFNADPAQAERFWLTSEYLSGFLDLIPSAFRRPGAWTNEFMKTLGPSVTVEPVPIPHDCVDGFYGAFWRRPRAYLDAETRSGISVFARLERRETDDAMRQLDNDLETGIWQTRHSDLLELEALDLGYMLITAEIA
jgi:hypothetical protein